MATVKNPAKKLYVTDLRYISYLETYSIPNEKVLMTHRPAGAPPRFAANLYQNSFWPMPEKPVIILHRDCKIASRDIDLMRAFWIVSERCKDAMLSVDLSAFDFLECDCFDHKGNQLEARWLCVVMRTLDVLDEEVTKVIIARGPNGAKGYHINSYDNIVLKMKEIPNNTQIFNMAHILRKIISTTAFKDEMKYKGIKNFLFTDVSKRQMPRYR